MCSSGQGLPVWTIRPCVSWEIASLKFRRIGVQTSVLFMEKVTGNGMINVYTFTIFG